MADDMTKGDYAKGIAAQLGLPSKEAEEVKSAPVENDPVPGSRGDDGKFKAKDKEKEADDGELDLDLADDSVEADDSEPDKRGASKKIEQLNYEVKNLSKQLTAVLAKIESRGGDATAKQVEQVKEIVEEIDELQDRDDLEEATVGDLRKLAKKAQADPALKAELAELRQELAEQKRATSQHQAERAFDRKYPDLAGQYEKLVEKAWNAADDRMPDAKDNDPIKIGRVQAYLELLSENAQKNKKVAPVKTKTPEPSARPDTSTKGAQIAGKSAAREAQSSTDPDAYFKQMARGIADQLTS